MASEHCGFTGWYLHIYIHLHGLTVVICEEWASTQMDRYMHTHLYTHEHTHVNNGHLSASYEYYK